MRPPYRSGRAWENGHDQVQPKLFVKDSAESVEPLVQVPLLCRGRDEQGRCSPWFCRPCHAVGCVFREHRSGPVVLVRFV